MRIGQLSQRAGVSAATVRYYERRGLLRKPQRTESNYRSYPAEAAFELRLIRWAKSVGFTLRETRELLDVVREHSLRPSDRARKRFAAKLREVEARMRELATMRDQLAALAACRCRGECPILARATGDTPPPHTRGRSR
jgi:DNA-binding transcriptional MerR regulator